VKNSGLPRPLIGLRTNPTISVDLDGVCADYVTPMRAICAAEYGIPEDTIPEPDSYNLAKATGWPIADSNEFLRVHAKAVGDHLYRRLPVLPGTKEALDYLTGLGFRIRITTHRLISPGLHQTVVSDTAAWLEEHGLPYTELCFTGDKAAISADLHVEDSPAAAIDLALAGQQTILMDRTYNRGITGILRVRAWEELIGVIAAMMNPL
jgi:hypothetical protein